MESTTDALKSLLLEAFVSADIVDNLVPALALVDQGVDSVDFPLFILALEKHYAIKIREEDALKLRTLNDVVAYLERRGANP
jgi:acyl carrier protein